MKSIKIYNSFKVDHLVSSIEIASSLESLIAVNKAFPDAIILGGGSNILFTRDQNKAVILVDIKGINIIEDRSEFVEIEVGAGEVWQDVVMWSLNQNLGGIENLSLIPGKCGAAPMQNIGAYGVELSEVLVDVKCLHRQTGKIHVFTKDECQLAYRESIFKNQFKGEFIIYSIRLRLTKYPYHKLNISYGDIKMKLSLQNISDPTIKDVSRVVTDIRNSKLPNPQFLPNAGSFFKNPIISIDQFTLLKNAHPQIPSYPVDSDRIKVPAAWLIDKCGWKGVRIGDVGVHEKQALVIVNHGVKSGIDILKLSQMIQTSVAKKFNVELEREVNIL